jgi:hypothetical protein
MKTFFISALAATALAVPAASVAQEVDPSFGVEEPRPINVIRRNGVHPLARILFFPLLPFVEAQAALSPDKASCWNDGAGEVAGCSIVEEIETAQENRPTPYAD